MTKLVCACDYNWSLRFLWGSEFEINQAKDRLVSENAVITIWGSCRLLVMGFLNAILSIYHHSGALACRMCASGEPLVKKI